MLKTPSIRETCTRVAQALHETRLERNLSMTQVAERAGLSRQIVSYTERGMRTPTLDTLLRLGEAMDVDVGELVSRAAKRK